MNDCRFLGRVGSEPEVRHTPNGNAVANFSIAVSEKDKQGNEKTEWVRCVTWGQNAGYAQQVLKKGTEVAILSSKVQTRSWEGKDGKKNYTTEFVVFRFRPCARVEKQTEAATQNSEPDFPAPAAQTQSAQNQTFCADDIPF